jgi:nitroreductase
MPGALPDPSLDQIFRAARTYKWWTDDPVTETDIRAIYELMKWGPTSGNVTPARFLWLTTDEAKRRLEPHLDPGNRRKTMKAPATVICAYDLDFRPTLARLNPAAMDWFDDPDLRAFEAFRSGTLQAAYLIIAARALGWDCGPQGGLDRAAVDAEFFAGTSTRTNFIVSIGRGATDRQRPRAHRLPFEEANRII